MVRSRGSDPRSEIEAALSPIDEGHGRPRPRSDREMGLRWVRGRIAVGLLLAATTLVGRGAASEPPNVKAQRNIVYAPGKDADVTRQALDVFTPKEGGGYPILLWIHGGGWMVGDKGRTAAKIPFCARSGYVLVAVNYRFVPKVDYRGQGADIARAIRWVRDHALEIGGDPKQIHLMGHSAGAHLAALVATDERYLKGEGMQLGDLASVTLLDGAAYDVARQIEASGDRLRNIFVSAFGTDPEKHRDASPIHHIKKETGIPPFLILYVTRRPDSRAQSEALAKALREAGGKAEVVGFDGKNHGTISGEFGLDKDPPTERFLEFQKKLREKT